MNAYAVWKNKGFSFFQNTSCEYFPCHSVGAADAGRFNCLFCFCPLYGQEDCGGVFSTLECGQKDCSLCVLPHQKENYGFITERLKNFAAREAEKHAA